MYPDREAAIEVLGWMQKQMKSRVGMVPERASIFDPLFFNSAIQYGEVLTVVGADWYGLDMLQQFTPDLKGKWGAMPLPAWKLPDGRLSRRTSPFRRTGADDQQGQQATGCGVEVHRVCYYEQGVERPPFPRRQQLPGVPAGVEG
ncbi:MAG: hypothetical protein CM1200mP29_07150 [Verrucomicrobiota bacterium]|nr:MAG: hypothetical protein CM1200mP29_07150 [Verrucomicrobiota bacterium]